MLLTLLKLSVNMRDMWVDGMSSWGAHWWYISHQGRVSGLPALWLIASGAEASAEALTLDSHHGTHGSDIDESLGIGLDVVALQHFKLLQAIGLIAISTGGGSSGVGIDVSRHPAPVGSRSELSSEMPGSHFVCFTALEIPVGCGVVDGGANTNEIAPEVLSNSERGVCNELFVSVRWVAEPVTLYFEHWSRLRDCFGGTLSPC